jgi:hypothetical protein
MSETPATPATSTSSTQHPRHLLLPLTVLLLLLLAVVLAWTRRADLLARYRAAVAAEDDAFQARRRAGERVGCLAGDLESGNGGEPERLLVELDAAEAEYLPLSRVWVSAWRALKTVQREADQEYPGDPAFTTPERESWREGPLTRRPRP